MWYGVALALVAGLGLPISVLGAAAAQGRLSAAAMEGIARQPDAAGDIRFALIVALSLIEALVIYALLMFFLLQGKLPEVTAVITAAGGG